MTGKLFIRKGINSNYQRLKTFKARERSGILQKQYCKTNNLNYGFEYVSKDAFKMACAMATLMEGETKLFSESIF